MRSDKSLYDVYRELANTDTLTVYVVPLIRYNYKKSDYLYLLYENLINDDKTDVKSLSFSEHWKIALSGFNSSRKIVHYHWLECSDLRSLFGMIYKFICLFIYTAMGGKLVWTIHNKMPHDGRFYRINYRLRKWMAHRADKLHLHCHSVIEEISRFFDVSESKFIVIPHPEFPANKFDRSIAIQKINQLRNLDLSVHDTIYLMFGNISKYKQIKGVCRIFSRLEDDKKLLIVGPVKKGQMFCFSEIKKLADINKNILLIPHFVKEEHVPYYFNAADCVLFNYREILTSGAVVLADSYNKPIIAPKLGCLSELSGSNHHLYQTEAEFTELIKSFGEAE